MSILKSIKSPSCTLDQLRTGDCAVVVDVSERSLAEVSAGLDIARRLKELGFIKGEAVKVLHRGYFGGEPLAVRIGQSTFALRRFEAALIGIAPAGSI